MNRECLPHQPNQDAPPRLFIAEKNCCGKDKKRLSWRNSATNLTKHLLCCSLLLLAIVAGGCGPRPPQLQQLAPMPQEPLCRIALLPFINESNYAQADLIVYKIFMSELANAANFDIAQEGDVRKTYRQLRIYPQQQPSFEQLRILADRLNAQMLITGTVHEAQETSTGNFNNPSLTISLQLIDARSGRILWNTYHTKKGDQYQKVMHFGMVSTLSGLAQRMSREVISLWLREGMKPCAASQ
ncbi:MAG: hypothetical protein OEV91_03465 [Desulfobulbaceae bacterium]|nr:hypothetical protein [Desulfobulbaceae bacterium]